MKTRCAAYPPPTQHSPQQQKKHPDNTIPPTPITPQLWHATTYRLESSLNYGMERVWSIGVMKGSNSVALGFDEGVAVVKVCLCCCVCVVRGGGGVCWR